MRTPDVNVLLYAVNQDGPHHAVARKWMESSFGRPEGIGFSWAALLGFLRLSTRTGIFAEPLGIDSALGVVDAWLGGRHSGSPVQRQTGWPVVRS